MEIEADRLLAGAKGGVRGTVQGKDSGRVRAAAGGETRGGRSRLHSHVAQPRSTAPPDSPNQLLLGLGQLLIRVICIRRPCTPEGGKSNQLCALGLDLRPSVCCWLVQGVRLLSGTACASLPGSSASDAPQAIRRGYRLQPGLWAGEAAAPCRCRQRRGPAAGGGLLQGARSTGPSIAAAVISARGRLSGALR